MILFFSHEVLWRIKPTIKVNICNCFVSLGGQADLLCVSLLCEYRSIYYKYLLQTDQTDTICQTLNMIYKVKEYDTQIKLIIYI